jgi:lysozyme
VGDDRLDSQFKDNWIGAKKSKLQGSLSLLPTQRKLSRTGGAFIKTVSLNKGDLPPVLDIEKLPETSLSND